MDNLAQKLSPILLKRIDPGNVQNIIMRPQGDTRLEIQVPLASADTQARRRAYDEAISDISKDNVNLATIKRTLAKEPGERDKVFAVMAGDSNDRREILAGLAAAYDARKTAQAKRDALKSSLDTIALAVGKAGVSAESLAGRIRRHGQRDITWISDRDQLCEHLERVLKPGDILLTLGAGNVWQVGETMLERLKKGGEA